MSWLYSAALVAEYLGENFSDGEQSAPLSGKPTPQAYLSHDKMTDSWSRFPSGMMCKPLTESRGEELLMSFREAFLVPTLVPLEKEQELTEKHQECGEKWQGSFAKYDQDSSLWKTHQCSLVGDLEEFLEIWPQWGLMRDGECWEQMTLAQGTKETEFGLLPTPVSSDYKGTSKNSKFQSRKKQYQVWDDGTEASTLYPNPSAYEVLMGWPLGWTDLKPLEMDKSPYVPQPHGEFLAKEIDE